MRHQNLDWGPLCLCRYNSLSILPAALGKPVRDVASKVCGLRALVGTPGAFPLRLTWALFLSFQAKAVGIHGNLSGDLLQSGGLLVVSKGGSGQDIEPHLAHLGGSCPHAPILVLGTWGGIGLLGLTVNYSQPLAHKCKIHAVDSLPVVTGGDKVLLHFIQKSPGDYVPQEDVLKALGISAELCSSKPPQVSRGLGGTLLVTNP